MLFFLNHHHQTKSVSLLPLFSSIVLDCGSESDPEDSLEIFLRLIWIPAIPSKTLLKVLFQVTFFVGAVHLLLFFLNGWLLCLWFFKRLTSRCLSIGVGVPFYIPKLEFLSWRFLEPPYKLKFRGQNVIYSIKVMLINLLYY